MGTSRWKWRDRLQMGADLMTKKNEWQSIADDIEIEVKSDTENKDTEKFLAGISAADEKGFPPAAFSLWNHIDDYNLDGVIKENQSVLENLPVDFYEVLSKTEKSWNYLTALETARRFDFLIPVHPELDRKKFWSALLKGGIQAAIYISDSI